MGYSNSHNSAAFLVIALVLFSTANPLAHGLGPILGPIVGPILGPFGPIVGPILGPLGPILGPITRPPPPPITLPVSPPISVGVPPLSPGLPIPINGTIVSGIICCTPTGTCPGTPVSGALVRVNCTSSITGTSVLVGQNTTGVNGTFNISIPNMPGVLPSTLGPFPCIVSLQPPLNQTICPVLSTVNASLVGIPGLITTTVTQLLGLVQVVVIGVFFGIVVGL